MKDHPEDTVVDQFNQTMNINSLNTLKCVKKGAFGRITDNISKKERLDDLLEKIEQYTRFILQQNIKTHKAQQRQKFTDGFLKGNQDNDQINGDRNVSKRR